MVTSSKTFCWPVSVLNFACIEHFNFDKSRRICLFVMTMQIIILFSSHSKMKDSPTPILVKGKQLSAGENSNPFTIARRSHRNKSKYGVRSSRCSNCHFSTEICVLSWFSQGFENHYHILVSIKCRLQTADWV